MSVTTGQPPEAQIASRLDALRIIEEEFTARYLSHEIDAGELAVALETAVTTTKTGPLVVMAERLIAERAARGAREALLGPDARITGKPDALRVVRAELRRRFRDGEIDAGELAAQLERASAMTAGSLVLLAERMAAERARRDLTAEREVTEAVMGPVRPLRQRRSRAA